MKVLFFGHAGWIGQQFLDYIQTIASPPCRVVLGQSRLDDYDAVEYEIQTANPTHVVSFTGRTHGIYNGTPINTIDYLEKPGRLVENLRDNLYGPMNLALLQQKYGFHYTYLGTGCIFSYDTSGHPFESEEAGSGFKDSDTPNFFGSSYSIVKGFTDRLFHHQDVLNLRIRMPITATVNSRNFITKIANYARICSIKNSMTVLSDFFPVWYDLMQKGHVGTVNCTNPGLISHNEVLALYKQYVDPTFVWSNFTLEEQSAILASARSNNFLDTTFIEKNYPTVPSIKASVEAVCKEMAGGISA
jgi:3,5-epimerase/4-reductase